MRNVDNGSGCVCVEAGDIQEISVSSVQHCHEPKTALKHKVYFKNQGHLCKVLSTHSCIQESKIVSSVHLLDKI